nr:immunoglobulin light chain junction region [Macaca mulatta]MOW43549.1 immunoglobulin light chain junction region [Macaca mulatta]MOW44388.1 immunoglobulin light chain junction region [Macaca mulatta]MOW45408.1 immunoglobulin light chain junction region [Macaca mulatta]
CQQYKNFPFTF